MSIRCRRHAPTEQGRQEAKNSSSPFSLLAYRDDAAMGMNEESPTSISPPRHTPYLSLSSVLSLGVQSSIRVHLYILVERFESPMLELTAKPANHCCTRQSLNPRRPL